MPIKTKDISRVADKWQTNAGQATDSYASGVQNPRTDWAQAAQAAAGNYKAGVTAAANKGSFAKGVARAGSAKQQQNALAKGVPRYSSGVAVAGPEYRAAMEPVLQVIASTTLPPKGPKGDPSNIQRVAAIATNLNKFKQSRG